MQPQYDYQAHSEQIRHQQIAADLTIEEREEEAAETAILALVGKKALSSASPVPQKAITSAQQTIATLKR